MTLTLAEVDPRRAGSGGGMLQTAQRVGSAIGVAVVLAQFFTRLASTDGDYAEALSTSLHTTIGLIVAALGFALADLVRRRRPGNLTGSARVQCHDRDQTMPASRTASRP